MEKIVSNFQKDDSKVLTNNDSNIYNIDSWYLPLKSFSIWTRIFKLPNKILEFFEEDSIIAENAIKILNECNNTIVSNIKELISEWDAVFPKIHSVSAKDSSFIIPEMKCLNLEEIFILLKSSARIFKEIMSNKQSDTIDLVLKKWYSIPVIQEFRIFICDYKVKGVSQRHLNKSYTDNNLLEIKCLIIDFCNKLYSKVCSCILDSKLNSKFSKNCIIDVVVYVNSNKVKIVDLEDFVFESSEESNIDSVNNTNIAFLSKSLLFTLKELNNSVGLSLINFKEQETKNINEFEVRVIDSVDGKSKADLEHELNAFPIELKEYGTSTLDELFKMTAENER